MSNNKKDLFKTNNGRLAEMLAFQRFTATTEKEKGIIKQAEMLYDNIGGADYDLFISQEMDKLAGYDVTARDITTGNIFTFTCDDISKIDFVSI